MVKYVCVAVRTIQELLYTIIKGRELILGKSLALNRCKGTMFDQHVLMLPKVHNTDPCNYCLKCRCSLLMQVLIFLLTFPPFPPPL